MKKKDTKDVRFWFCVGGVLVNLGIMFAHPTSEGRYLAFLCILCFGVAAMIGELS